MDRRSSRSRGGKGHRAGRPSTAETAARIERLLDVAAETFLEMGYEGASVEEIARRANSSKQTLYSRYPSKADLFCAVIRRRSEAAFQVLADVTHSNEPVDKVLSRYAAILIFPLLDKAALRLLRVVIASAEAFPEVARGFWEVGPTRVHRILADFLRERMTRGELRRGDPMEAAYLFTALCTGRFWSQGLMGIRPGPSRSEVEAYTERLVRGFLGLYSGPEVRQKL